MLRWGLAMALCCAAFAQDADIKARPLDAPSGPTSPAAQTRPKLTPAKQETSKKTESKKKETPKAEQKEDTLPPLDVTIKDSAAETPATESPAKPQAPAPDMSPGAIAKKLLRPTEIGATPGKRVAAFWFIAPK